VWTDEKWFTLRPTPNKQNVRPWGPEPKQELIECAAQGDAKVMAWCGFVDGHTLKAYCFMCDNHKPVSVTGESYGLILQNHMWPQLRALSTRKQYWFRQAGARPHTSASNLEFLTTKFSNRVMSRNFPNSWPAFSLDLSPFDLWLWGFLLAEVCRCKLATINELIDVVDDVLAVLGDT
jgi:hypothetical protein